MTATTLQIGPITVEVTDKFVRWTSGLAVDVDGSPNTYGPPGTNHLDAIANAGGPGNWYGVITDTGERDGTPVVQGPGDPCPGCYVSGTALVDHTKKPADPLRYVPGSTFPYASLPPELIGLLHMGDVGLVEYEGRSSAAIAGDVGPHRKLGEGSQALAAALGLPSSPRTGGCASGVRWTFYRGSRTDPAWPRPLVQVQQQVAELSAAAYPPAVA